MLVLGIEPRALCMLGKGSTSELHSKPLLQVSMTFTTLVCVCLMPIPFQTLLSEPPVDTRWLGIFLSFGDSPVLMVPRLH